MMISEGCRRSRRCHVSQNPPRCIRAGRGHGWTLGEAPVSEGLAGRFVRHLLGVPLERQVRTVPDALLKADLPDQATLVSGDDDHRAWFYGVGGQYPRWLGHSLGDQIVWD